MLLLFLLALFNVCLIIAVSWFVLFLYVFFHHEGDFLQSLTFKASNPIMAYGTDWHAMMHAIYMGCTKISLMMSYEVGHG